MNAKLAKEIRKLAREMVKRNDLAEETSYIRNPMNNAAVLSDLCERDLYHMFKKSFTMSKNKNGYPILKHVNTVAKIERDSNAIPDAIPDEDPA